MKRSHISVPEPRSKFLRLKCGECSETQIVYSHATTKVTCNSCGNTISVSTGSVAGLNGEVLGEA